MNILVFKVTFEPNDPDQKVQLFLGNCNGSEAVELTDREHDGIRNAVYSALTQKRTEA